jgi:hypothetical protein
MGDEPKPAEPAKAAERPEQRGPAPRRGEPAPRRDRQRDGEPAGFNSGNMPAFLSRPVRA